MKSPSSRCAFAAVAAVALSVSASAKTCTWINAETGTAQSWTVAENWQDGAAPSAGDDVLVENAAAIDFAGADLGSLTYTGSGTLTIDSGNGTMTNRGDFTATTVLIKNTSVYLPEGDHVWTHSGSLCFGPKTCTVHFTGPGSQVKAGAGTMQQNERWSSAQSIFQMTGALVIREGTVQVMQYGATFGGTKELVIDGRTAALEMQQGSALGTIATVRLLNSGKFKAYASYSVAGLFVDGKACAAGTWGAWNSTTADYRTLNVIVANQNNVNAGCLKVTIEPEDPYSAEDFALFSGTKAVWTGAAGTTTWTDSANWQDGVVPSLFDDVEIPAGVTVAPNFNGNNYLYFHSIDAKSAFSVNCQLNLSGDLVATGFTTAFRLYPKVTFLSEVDHVMDVSAPVNVDWHNSVKPGPFVVSGSLTKRGAGKVTIGTQSGSDHASVPVGVTLAIEEGEVALGSAEAKLQCTNVVVAGASGALTVKGAVIDTNAVVSVSNGGRLNLSGSFTQKVRGFVKDGDARRAGRTYGSASSGADVQDDVTFSGAGLLLPWFKVATGFLLYVR